MSPLETVLAFLNRINQHDADRLAELMSDDHVFIDSLGKRVEGREKMRAGWQSYFTFCPDYWVSHDETFHDGGHVAVFGEAGGTVAEVCASPPDNKWHAYAAWLAIVENGLIKQWRVYADNKPVYDIISRQKKP